MKNLNFCVEVITYQVGVKGNVVSENISTMKRNRVILYRKEEKGELRASQTLARSRLSHVQTFRIVSLSFGEKAVNL